MEVSKMKEQIKKYEGENRIVEYENQLRDQKRQVVTILTDNIFVLKNGFRGKKAIV